MKVGSLVYATSQGLGILAKDFYDNGIITDAIVVRHGKHQTHEEWYPGSLVIGDLADRENKVKRFCESMDVMLFFETPFIWPLINHCRAKGVKTVLMPMHECLHKTVWSNLPDLFLCPSLLDLQVCEQYNAVFLPVPVAYPWALRERARVFVHNAGHGGLKGRNGTDEIIEAIGLLKSPAKFIIRSQGRIPNVASDRVQTVGVVPYDKLFAEGDVFLFPEKFNGLSLPLQEARAAGMLVMCGDRFPMNEWLPREPLIPVAGYRKERIGPPYQEFDEAIIEPRAIAATIDAYYDRDISEYSHQGKEWAEANSWAVLGQQYKAVLEGLL